MNTNIQFTADSPVDIHPELAEKFNIKTIPLHVHLDDKEYFDGEIEQQFIYDTYKEKKILPSTSAISVGEYAEFFQKFLDEGKEIIHMCISSGISSTYQNAVIAVQDLEAEDKIHVFDSLALSQATGLPLFKAAEMAQNDATTEEIVDAINDMIPRVDSSFMITSLEFLRHGGRCSTLQALGANLLKLKPLITMDGGSMGVGKKYRGKLPQAYLDYIDDRLDGVDYDHQYAFISNVLVEQEYIDAVVDHLKTKYSFENVYVTNCSCVITAHGGKGALACFYLKNK